MPAIQLTIAERKAHRAEAHHLDPVVMIGNDGLTPAVVKETDAALKAHGLIKVRVLGDDRAAARAMYQQLADELSAAPIQHIGKLLVLWRPKPDKARPSDEDRMPGPRTSRSSSTASAAASGPRSRPCACWATSGCPPGGQVKRAKPKQKSVKKGRLD